MEHLLYDPVVYTVGDNYQIMLVTDCKGLMNIYVGQRRFSDNFGGVVRSETLVHRVTVPRRVLDAERKYTIGFAKLDDHVPYFNKPEPELRKEYDFTPVPEKNAHFYMLADTHNSVDAPVAAALAQNPDALIFNGDIGDSADTLDQILTIYKISEKITRGQKPVIYSRGNHDTRGHCAEHLGNYIGLDNGNTFFTFRFGEVFGIVLDAGEDKPDICAEYGGVADFVPLREAQTEFLKKILESREYAAEGIKYRVAVCHMAFTRSDKYFTQPSPEIYDQWISLLNKMGIDKLLCGHCHEINRLPDGDYHRAGEKPQFEVIIGATWNNDPINDRAWIGGQYTGTDIKFNNGKIEINFTNANGKTVDF